MAESTDTVSMPRWAAERLLHRLDAVDPLSLGWRDDVVELRQAVSRSTPWPNTRRLLADVDANEAELGPGVSAMLDQHQGLMRESFHNLGVDLTDGSALYVVFAALGALDTYASVLGAAGRICEHQRDGISGLLTGAAGALGRLAPPEARS